MRGADSTVRILIADHAVHAATDNNGAGDPRTVVVDTSTYGTFGAASVMTVDASTNLANGPVGTSVSVQQRIPVTLNGYGFAVLTLSP